MAENSEEKPKQSTKQSTKQAVKQKLNKDGFVGGQVVTDAEVRAANLKRKK